MGSQSGERAAPKEANGGSGRLVLVLNSGSSSVKFALLGPGAASGAPAAGSATSTSLPRPCGVPELSHGC